MAKWTSTDEHIVLSILLENLPLGKSKSEWFRIASSKVNRSYHAIAYHWHNNMKYRYEDQIEKSISQRNTFQLKTPQMLLKENKLYLREVIDYVNQVNQ